MEEYTSLIMMAGFAIALYIGTRLWTEKFFPEKDKKQQQFDFEQAKQKSAKNDAPQELAGARH